MAGQLMKYFAIILFEILFVLVGNSQEVQLYSSNDLNQLLFKLQTSDNLCQFTAKKLKTEPWLSPYLLNYCENAKLPEFSVVQFRHEISRSRTNRIKQLSSNVRNWQQDLRIDLLAEYYSNCLDVKSLNEMGLVFEQIDKVLLARKSKYLNKKRIDPGDKLGPYMSNRHEEFASDKAILFGKIKELNSKNFLSLKLSTSNYGFFSYPNLCQAVFLNNHHMRNITEFNIVSRSILYSSEPIVLIGGYRSLIICDGDCIFSSTRGSHSLCNLLIITNGDFDSNIGMPSDSFVYASGKISFGKSDNNSFHSRSTFLSKTKFDPSINNFTYNQDQSKENISVNPLGVRFFELSEVGLKVAVKDEKVTIAELSKESFLAKAFRTGDVIRKINGLKMTSEHDVRRQMRSTVVWDAGIFEVERDGKAQHYLVKPNFFPLDKK
ncbi:MAG: hypothetical protein R3B84_00150 [Zavarzinella sp.]